MPHPTRAIGRPASLGLALALLAAPATAQEGGASGAGAAAIPLADPPPSVAPADRMPAGPDRRSPAPQGPTPPARVAIELGDVELKVRSLRIVLALDPDRAAALGEALTDMAVRGGAEPDG